MNSNHNSANWKIVVLGLLLAVAGLTGAALAQDYQNSITFVNQSGEDAVVKLIGPVRLNIPVPNAANNSVRIPPGSYYILTRYCDGRGICSYSKGEPFSVTQTATEYSEIEITLHKAGRR